MSPGIEIVGDILHNEDLWCDIYRKWDVSDRIFDTSCDMFRKLGLKRYSRQNYLRHSEGENQCSPLRRAVGRFEDELSLPVIIAVCITKFGNERRWWSERKDNQEDESRHRSC